MAQIHSLFFSPCPDEPLKIKCINMLVQCNFLSVKENTEFVELTAEGLPGLS